MSRRYRYLLIVIAVVLAGAFAWWYSRPAPVSVEVAAVGRGPVEATVANTRAGTVEACRRSKLSPAVGGQIATLDVHKGERVRRGQILLRLWNKDLAASLALARADVAAARDRTRAACLAADAAAREAERYAELREQNFISANQLDKLRTGARTGAADCRAAGANEKVAQARVKLAEANLERTVLKAPFDGTVAEINGELDEYVTPSPPGIPTRPVIDLIESGCYYVAAPIDEVDAAKVRLGMPVRVTLDAYGKQVFPGTVSRIGAYVVDREKQARTVDVDVRLDPGAGLDRPLAGYSADVEIILQARPDVLRVPTEAVVNGDGVYVYDAAKRVLRFKRFRPGLSNWSWTEVLSGLDAGEQVVTSVDRKGVADGAAAVVQRGGANP